MHSSMLYKQPICVSAREGDHNRVPEGERDGCLQGSKRARCGGQRLPMSLIRWMASLGLATAHQQEKGG